MMNKVYLSSAIEGESVAFPKIFSRSSMQICGYALLSFFRCRIVKGRILSLFPHQVKTETRKSTGSTGDQSSKIRRGNALCEVEESGSYRFVLDPAEKEAWVTVFPRPAVTMRATNTPDLVSSHSQRWCPDSLS